MKEETPNVQDHETHQCGGRRRAGPARPGGLLAADPTAESDDQPAVAAAPAKAAATSIPAGSFEPSPIEVWRLVQPKYAYENGRFVLLNAPAATTAAAKPVTAAFTGFEQAGGDAGWQLAQHKYHSVNGKLAMSDECDHAIRTAQAPTPAEVESARRLSPGA